MSKVKYTNDHEWLRDEEDGTYTLGITRYAEEQLGDIVYVQLPETGSRFSAGDEIVVIESVKAAADIRMPIGGEVVAGNEALQDNPEKINEDPMQVGWFLRIRPDDPGALDALLDEDAYRQLIGGSAAGG